ncbi:hypothetical protein [Spirosoma linguale]|uniref:hypothetical protein n=1 Tax=Spirosoma linguale TaxID=108 RepID=UPI0005A124CF
MALIDEKWRCRQSRASETIRRCKWMDGLKNSPTVKELIIQFNALERDYYQSRKEMLNEVQALNTSPNEVPIQLFSFDQLMDHFGIPQAQEEIDVGNMIVVPWVDQSHYLEGVGELDLGFGLDPLQHQLNVG